MKKSILFLLFVSCTGLNIIAPNVYEISKSLGMDELKGLVSIGGLNYFLIYIPMAFSSFFFFFYDRKKTIPLSALTLLLAFLHCSVFFIRNFYTYSIINFLIGSSIGVLVPSCYQYLKALGEKNTMQTVGLVNISIGVGLAVGQYFSGIRRLEIFLFNHRIDNFYFNQYII